MAKNWWMTAFQTVAGRGTFATVYGDNLTLIGDIFANSDHTEFQAEGRGTLRHFDSVAAARRWLLRG